MIAEAIKQTSNPEGFIDSRLSAIFNKLSTEKRLSELPERKHQ
jgi:hypothetical protein